MPTYEYRCTKCGKEWEQFQSILAAPEKKCPKCGRATAQRKITTGAGILTGGASGRSDHAEAAAAERTAATPAPAAAADAKPIAADASAKSAVPAPGKHAAMPGAAAKPGAAASPAPGAPPTPAATSAAGSSTSSASAPADTGSVNATHPAREGRGAGNLRDAIARQRRDGARTPPTAKKPGGGTRAGGGASPRSAPSGGKRPKR